MGFGTLLAGYFFLVNISYFSYTDIIAAMAMLTGLYKLTPINKNFKFGAYACILFSFFGLFEISLTAIELFTESEFLSGAFSYISALRYTFMFVITLFILRGIQEVATDVEALSLAKSAKTAIPLSSLFLVTAIFELPFWIELLGNTVAYVYFALLLSVVVFVISNLITIYKAYMQICMPDELEKHPKKSKLEFMNRVYDSIEEKSKAYAEYKLNESIKKNKRRKHK